MASEKWKPDTREALKTLIRQTIDAAGPIDASVLPHRLKDRLKDQTSDDIDLDAVIREVIGEKAEK